MAIAKNIDEPLYCVLLPHPTNWTAENVAEPTTYNFNNKKYKSTIKETTLSISIPKNEEEFNKFETYQLIKIGGYITPPPSKMKNIKKLKKNVEYLLFYSSLFALLFYLHLHAH